jgi:hypothetical protein
MEPETPIEKEMGGLFWGQGPGETGVVRGREYRTACAVPLLFAMHASTARLAPCRFCLLCTRVPHGLRRAAFVCYARQYCTARAVPLLCADKHCRQGRS